jgi:hypothetical protein
MRKSGRTTAATWRDICAVCGDASSTAEAVVATWEPWALPAVRPTAHGD